MKASEVDKKYCWNFEYLFKNEIEWKKSLQDYLKINKEIAKLEGKLNIFSNFENYIKLSNDSAFLAAKLTQYIHYRDLNTTDEKFNGLYDTFVNVSTEISKMLSWTAPELKKIGRKKIDEFISKNKNLEVYRYEFIKFFRDSKHILKSDKELLLSQVSKTRSAVYGLYDQLVYADKELVFIEYKGEKKELTEALYKEIIEDTHPITDQKLRLDTTLLYSKHIIEKKHSLAKVYEGILQYSVEEMEIRKYSNTLDAALSDDNVNSKLYLKLLKIGEENANLYRDYIKLKKSYLKLDKFYSSDRLLTIGQASTTKYSVDEGIKMVKEALSFLGKDYCKNLDIALETGKVDYYPDTNKRSGAYSSSGPGVNPIILMNWDNSYRSVATLAHELGHSVHTLFANTRPYPENEYPIFLAEVASTVNEHFLFDYFYQKTSSNLEKIDMLDKRLGDLFATFFRQIHFANFEYETHKLVEKSEPLNANLLANLFNSISLKYGDDVFDDKPDEYNSLTYSWTRILHFFHSPYYVYKYATSVAASFKLYDDVKKSKQENLIKFLKAGGHKDPLSILKDIGIDLTADKAYKPLMKEINRLLNEFKKIINKIKI